mgnify:CR=1 FL=1
MNLLFRVIVTLLLILSAASKGLAEDKAYVGSLSCRECHEQEYNRFVKYSKKASSYKSIQKMETKLTPQEFTSCFECHTTGYGEKGGFVSVARTPELKDAGCEVCHGPGSLHVETEDPDEIIGRVDQESCQACHSSDRIEVFDFKPLLFGGAH